MAWLVMLLSCLVGTAVGYSSYDLSPDLGAYDDSLMQSLYKRLADIDPSYFVDRPNFEPPVDDAELYDTSRDWINDDDGDASRLKSLPRSPVAGGQTDTRDSEYIGHSSNAGSDGFIYMSGRCLLHPV